MRIAIPFTIALAAAALLCQASAGITKAATPGETRLEVAETGPAKDTQQAPAHSITRGRRGRRVSRMDAWVEGLEGDRRKVYEEHGHPSGRHREEKMGTVIETWTYSNPDRTFRFKGDKLVR